MRDKVEIDLARDVLPVYWNIFEALVRWLLLWGGRAAGRSYASAQKTVLHVMEGERRMAGAFRKVGNTRKRSVVADIQAIIDHWGLKKYFKYNRTEHDFLFLPLENPIITCGVDQPDKFQSIKNLTFAWCEEATQFTRKDIRDINMVVGRDKRDDVIAQILLSFNPQYNSWIKDDLFDNPTKLFKKNSAEAWATYKDNPFVSESLIAEIEDLINQDMGYYKMWCLGKWTMLKGAIFTNWEIVDEMPDDEFFDDIIAGVDFGFTHPFVFLKVGWKENDIYIEQKIYEEGLEPNDQIEAMNREVPDFKAKHYEIYADNNRPDTIQQLSDLDWNIFAAEKPPGSVLDSIQEVKNYNLKIVEDSTSVTDEIKAYKWKEDKLGNPIEGSPVKINDHAMDAMRYAIYSYVCKYKRSSGVKVRQISLGGY